MCDTEIGTPKHRHECHVTKTHRGRCIDDRACSDFVSKLRPEAALLLETRALLSRPDLSEHRPNTVETLVWELRPADGVIEADSVIYTDGSMVDGPGKELGRVGFGFAAYDHEGTLTAKAFGTPPHWINSVPGAEAWALCEALRHSVPGAELWSDCLSVVNRFKAGRAAATSSAVSLARLWGTIFDLCDSFSDPAAQVKLEWMPAHTSAAQVGHARKGNGVKLTTLDRRGNNEADRLAKKGARSHAVPLWKQAQFKTAERVALRAALQLGVTTFAANNHPREVLKLDGTSGLVITRDCEGLAKAKRPRSAKAASVESPLASLSDKYEKVAPPAIEVDKVAPPATKATLKGKCKATKKRRPSAGKPQFTKLGTLVQPTKQFLQREALNLTEAATASREGFLALSETVRTASCAPEGSTAKVGVRVATSKDERATVTRPTKTKAGTSASITARKATESIAALLGGKAVRAQF